MAAGLRFAFLGQDTRIITLSSPPVQALDAHRLPLWSRDSRASFIVRYMLMNCVNGGGSSFVDSALDLWRCRVKIAL